MTNFSTRTMVQLIVGLVLGATFIPVISGLVAGAQTYTYTTYQTLNEGFTDNADNWDNYVESNAVNDWTSDYINTTVIDVLDLYENGVFYQALSVPSISDGIYSATLSFDWRLIDNDNISAMNFAVYLDNSTDNILIWNNTSIENTTTWNSQENNIITIIDAIGTYTIYLRAEIKPDSGEAVSNIIAGWDDASLSIVTQTERRTTAQIMADLLPLFFVVGLVLAIILVLYNKHD